MSVHTKVEADLVGVERWDRGWLSANLTRMPFTLRYLPWRMLKVLSQHLDHTAARALEIGCGGGKWMALFADPLGFQVYGLDYSQTGCRLARQQLVGENLSGEIVCGDAFSAPFALHSFDVVYSLGVIEHFRDPTQILTAMRSLLKPGGQLVVGVPNMNGLMGCLHRLADRDLWLRHTPLTLEDMIRLYKMQNLEVQHANYVGTLCLAGPNWGRLLRSESLAAVVRAGLAGMEIALTWPLRVLNLQFESPRFSPYILVIGRKPEEKG